MDATLLLFVLFGLAIGSFGNVLSHRLPAGQSISGRSNCPHCKGCIAWYDLLPLVSYLCLVGRCRNCKQRIHWQYPVVELLSGLLFAVAHLWTQDPVLGGVLAMIFWLLLIITVIDLQTQTIPDALNFPLITLGILYSFLLGSFSWLALVLGAAPFALQWAISRGRWVGSGDIILGAGIGAMLGMWPKVLIWLLVSYVGGALVVCILLITKQATRRSYVPFAPFLTVGAIITVFAYDAIVTLLLY